MACKIGLNQTSHKEIVILRDLCNYRKSKPTPQAYASVPTIDLPARQNKSLFKSSVFGRIKSEGFRKSCQPQNGAEAFQPSKSWTS